VFGDHPLGGGHANVSTTLRPVQGSEMRKEQKMGRSVNNRTERSKSNATQKPKTTTAPNTGLTCKQMMEYLQRKIQGEI